MWTESERHILGSARRLSSAAASRAWCVAATLVCTAGCTHRCPDPAPPPGLAVASAQPRPATTPSAAPVRLDVPTCELDGEKDVACRLVGIYALERFTTPGGRVTNVWPVLLLSDGGFVLLENPWHPETRPEPAVIARHEGERVEGIGVLRAQPPLPDEHRKMNLEMPCMTPIHAVTALGDGSAAGKE